MKISSKGIKKKLKKITGKISFEWLFDKRVLVILSVVISVVFWFYITLNVSPNEEKTFADVPVTIDLKAIDSKGLVLLDIMDTAALGDKTYTVPVTVRGNRYSLTQLKKEDILVTAQLANVIEDQPNNYTLSLKVTCSNNLYDVTVESSVESITVKLDVLLTKPFAIKTKTNSTATAEKENYAMESPITYVGNEKITDVTISGPQAAVNKIASVEVFAEGAKDLKETTDFADGIFVLLNESGAKISGSDLNYVAVTAIEEQYENIPVSDAKVTVRVPIRVNTTVKIVTAFNESRVGKDFNFAKLESGIKIAPEKNIGIKYAPNINLEDPIYDVIKTLELKTDKIDISSITPTNNVYSFTTSFPAGIELTGGLSGSELTVDVIFDLDGYTTKTLQVNVSEENFKYDSAATEMRIIPSGTLNVTFVGPKAEISKLTDENIAEKVNIIADVSTVTTAGTVSLPVNIHVKGKTSCWVTGTNEELSLSVTVTEQ